MKKLLGAILAVVIAAGSVPAVERGAVGTVAAAADTITKDNLVYTVMLNGNLRVTGVSNKNTITKADIPSEVDGKKVVEIGSNAFNGCNILSTVTIPESVTYIGTSAFLGCIALTTLTINGAAEIDDNAFSYCQKLSDLKMDNIIDIGSLTFSNCTSLTEITIPQSVTHLGASGFYGCTGLKKVTVIGDKNMGTSVFSNCTNLTTAIMDDLSFLSPSFFNKCTNLTTVSIKNAAVINNNCFSECTSLTTVNMDSVKIIDNNAFNNCTSLSVLNLPASFESMAGNALNNCTGLTRIDVAEENETYSSIDGVLFDKEGALLQKYPCGRTETIYTVPDSVLSIGENAFNNCTNLNSVIIPEGVLGIGASAFSNCTNLNFVKIPEGVGSISSNAFYYCKNLKSIALPVSLIVIGPSAFYSCKNLKDVYYAGTEEQWEDIDISNGNSDLKLYAHKHFESTGPAFVPVEITVLLPEKDAPEITGLQAETTVDGETVILPIDDDGNLDTTGIPNGTYTFTFSADQCAPKGHEVTVTDGEVTGLEDGLELHLLGDINGDGVVNTQDVAKANAHVKGTATLTGYELTCINVNVDAFTNVQDVALMNAHAKNTKKLW